MSLLAREFNPKVGRERFMLEMKEDIPNECIFSVCSRVILINLKFHVFGCIKQPINVIVMLCNGEFFHISNLHVHVNLEIGANLAKDKCKKCQTFIFFVNSIQSSPRVNITVLFDCLTCRIADKLNDVPRTWNAFSHEEALCSHWLNLLLHPRNHWLG
jgi:hypothetical protein